MTKERPVNIPFYIQGVMNTVYIYANITCDMPETSIMKAYQAVQKLLVGGHTQTD
jgi:hypothetical protein